MNYTETIEYIHSRPKFSRVLGNKALLKLLGHMGDPQKELKYIHIAGTNGKGSTAVMTASVLMEAGYKTGLFTSPYLRRFNERIRIDGDEIDDDELAEIATYVRRAIEENDAAVSEFALNTAVAFEYFRRKGADYVVLETGLGGRLDATNVIDAPEIVILTSIGLDHTQYLGDTIEKIAAEKCGIIKKNSTVALSPGQPVEARSVIKRFCADTGSKLIEAKEPCITDDGLRSGRGAEFEYDGESYRLSLRGGFQPYNAAAVIEAMRALSKRGADRISAETIKTGIEKAYLDGRFDLIRSDEYGDIIIDGAHNPPAMSELAKSLKKLERPVNLVVAMMGDKDAKSAAAAIIKAADSATVTEIEAPRGMTAEELKAIILGEDPKADVVAEPDPIKAFEAAAKRDGITCVCGSIYLAGMIERYLDSIAQHSD